jgi:hypothetical protein
MSKRLLKKSINTLYGYAVYMGLEKLKVVIFEYKRKVKK